MDNNEKKMKEVEILFSLAMDGEINDEQFEKLKSLLKSDKAVRDHYYGLVNISVLLGDYNQSVAENKEFETDVDILHEMAEYEKMAPAVHIEKHPRY